MLFPAEPWAAAPRSDRRRQRNGNPGRTGVVPLRYCSGHWAYSWLQLVADAEQAAGADGEAQDDEEDHGHADERRGVGMASAAGAEPVDDVEHRIEADDALRRRRQRGDRIEGSGEITEWDDDEGQRHGV